MSEPRGGRDTSLTEPPVGERPASGRIRPRSQKALAPHGGTRTGTRPPDVITMDTTVEDPETFRAVLADLIAEANRNGVAVGGGWEVDPSRSERAWDVEIARLE